jgi:hypothetical protein
MKMVRDADEGRTPHREHGAYVPAGEGQGQRECFDAEAIARAFEVDLARVERAITHEFRLDARSLVDSRQAQHLAEVILGDQPLDVREAALMRLGAFTPRPDHAWGLGETPPGEESDRLIRSSDTVKDTSQN